MAGDIEKANYDSKYKSVGNENASPYGFFFNPDGENIPIEFDSPD